MRPGDKPRKEACVRVQSVEFCRNTLMSPLRRNPATHLVKHLAILCLSALTSTLGACSGGTDEANPSGAASDSGNTSSLTTGSTTSSSSTSTTGSATTASTTTTGAVMTTATSSSVSGFTASTSSDTSGTGGSQNLAATTGGGPTSANTATSTDGQGGAGGASTTGQDASTTGQSQGGSSAGGTGGSSGYAPCPSNGDACIILPFGDSITDGVGSTDQSGYRAPLFGLVVAANQKITFVGSRSSGPNQVSGQAFPKNHEGHPGWTIDPGYVSYGEGIRQLIPSPAFDTMPHIVLLMIGTNDVNSDHGTDMIAERLETLLDDIVGVAPDALVVVAVPTPLSWNPSSLQNYSAKIPQIVEARVAEGQHMIVADMSKMPTNNLGSDGVHPNDQGYSYMANVWYEAIKDVLPE